MGIIILLINKDMGHEFYESEYVGFVKLIIEGKLKWKYDFYFEQIMSGAGWEETAQYTIPESFLKYKYVYPVTKVLYDATMLLVQSIGRTKRKQ